MALHRVNDGGGGSRDPTRDAFSSKREWRARDALMADSAIGSDVVANGDDAPTTTTMAMIVVADAMTITTTITTRVQSQIQARIVAVVRAIMLIRRRLLPPS